MQYVTAASSQISDTCVQHLEVAARAAIASEMGRPLSDQEWTPVSRRVVEFVRILRYWQQGKTMEESTVAGTSVLDGVALNVQRVPHVTDMIDCCRRLL